MSITPDRADNDGRKKLDSYLPGINRRHFL